MIFLCLTVGAPIWTVKSENYGKFGPWLIRPQTIRTSNTGQFGPRSLVNSDLFIGQFGPQQEKLLGQFGPFRLVSSGLFHWSIWTFPFINSDFFQLVIDTNWVIGSTTKHQTTPPTHSYTFKLPLTYFNITKQVL